MLDIVGALLPSAAGIALSPFPIIAVILVVTGPRAGSAGPAFAVGWLVGLSALTAVAVTLGELVGRDEAATWASWARVLLGAALVGLGVRKLLGRRPGDEPASTPGWMAGVAAATAGRALLVGFGLAAGNPKNVAFALASASIIGQADQSSDEVLAEAAVFVLLASLSVLGVLLVGWLAGEPGARALVALEQRLVVHNEVIVAAVLLLIGANVLGTGLAGLG